MNDQTRMSSAGAKDPVAIVGMSCNLPGDNRTPDAFFEFLNKKKCGIVEIPKDRWNAEVFYNADPGSIASSVSKWGGFLSDIRGFDAKFFGISPREADGMDPQQRLALQGAVEAMMDAQIPLEEFSRQSTGVFIGISQSEYRTLQEMRITGSESYAGTGYALCISANRISHRLNLTGPSYAIDTACSSSLMALNQAIQNLRTGACDMAIVGGVNALTHPSSFLAFSKAGMVSPTGQVSTFDASANGFVRGEGAGTVVIKPLSRAQADGDRIHAVIHGTAANQDGATNTITAPSQSAQIAMLRSLFDSVDIRPDQIGFVEAHGTGTPIGDPIEAGAIGTVIGQRTPDHPVYIGSSKANIGHLESGAGIAGLIKAAMAVKTGIIPPNIRFKNPNPDIPFDALNLEVPIKPEAFPDTQGGRHAVVNSFGFGGANACALVSAPPARNFDYHPVLTRQAVDRLDVGEDAFAHFVPISGATQEALLANADAVLKAMRGKGKMASTELNDIAAALATKRSHLMYRAVFLVRTRAQLMTALRQFVAGKTDAANIILGQKQTHSKICFTFSGQGSQWWGMARDLLTRNKAFSTAVDDFDAEFIPIAGWSIRTELLKDQASSRIDDTTVTQPALFAIQTGLAAVWKQIGVEPDMVVGHSIGEAGASYLANGLSLKSAARFLSKRGAIRDKLGAKGAMAAIGMNHLDVEAILPLDEKLGIAAINGPGSTTISGDYDALHQFVEEFQYVRPDTFIRTLTVDTAWHSYHLDAGEAWFRDQMGSIDWSVPTLPFISTVTGRVETRFDTNYGWLNLRRPVRYQAAVEAALDLGATKFVELGPAATLAGPTKSTALEAGVTVSVLNSINRKENDFDVIARAAASLFVEGQDLNWPAITGSPKSHVDLPPNTWVEEPFWQESEESKAVMFTRTTNAFLGKRERSTSISWTSEINLRAFAYLKDHRMQSDVIFPAAGYLDTMLALCREYFGPDKIIEIEDAIIHEALFIAPEQDVLFNTTYDAGRGRAKFYSRIRDAEDDWVLRCEGKVRVYDVPASNGRRLDTDTKGFKEINADYVYDVDPRSAFINYGPAFQTVKKLWMSRTKTVARVVLSEEARSTSTRHHLHPTILDGCLQLLEPRMTLKRFAVGHQQNDQVCMPVGFGRMRVYADFPSEVMVEADQFKGGNDPAAAVGFTVYDLDGNMLMSVEDVRVKMLPSKKIEDKSGEVPAHFVRQHLVESRDQPGPALTNGRWVILVNGPQDHLPLTATLEALGASVQRIARAELGDDPGGALADLLGDEIEDGALSGVVVTWPLALHEVGESTATDVLFDPLNGCCKDLISLGELMDYARIGTNGLPEFVFLTSGAYPDGAGRAIDANILSQMPVASLVRGLATEAPEYDVQIIDADGESLRSPMRVAEHILSRSVETELVLRDGKCFAPRLTHVADNDFDPNTLTLTKADTSINFHATMRSPGVIDNVKLVEIPLQPIGPTEVRVRIAAVGLNFRDVMAVTGLLPKEAETEPAWQNLGLEFGGVVEEIGNDVTSLKPGDRVMGFGNRCLQRFMTVYARDVTPLPDGISLAQAATIPSAFSTAHYALNHVGRMRQGDRVFIHVATGGVGTAAVQLAQAAGAEIFATAGSKAKRRHLKNLGVQHVMDSRSLKFADDVMRITNGKGVDILLNSLPGDFITKGLDIMAPYGRFIEIGKRDVYEDASIGLKSLRRNVSLSVLDLAAMGKERPELMAELFEELAVMLDRQTISPLPVTEFPIDQVSDAIRHMSQAKHMGKVVVSLEADEFRVSRDENRKVTLSKTGSYLITGGTGGFSLSIADGLSQMGAGHLWLASRSGSIAKADAKKVAKMRARGTDVTVVALDITDADAVDQFIAESQMHETPLRGIVHGAAVIKDGFANQLSSDMISDVLAPKVKGAWNLHRAVGELGIELDFMIGFSSIAQTVGSAGQCNYIAGNAFLDALAHYRLSLGKRGTAINWGVVADAGFVARNAALGSYLESIGQFGLVKKDFSRAMEVAIACDTPTFVYSRADWELVARANAALGKSPRIASVLSNEGGATTEVRARMLQLTGESLLKEAEDFIKGEVTSVLKIDKNTIQIERPMSELGLDSLSSFELKIRIETALETSIPVSKFLQAPSIQELATLLADEMEHIRKTEATIRTIGDDAVQTQSGAGLRRGALASNLQLGLLRDARAPMTSECAKLAMEHYSEVHLARPNAASDFKEILKTLERRHPLLCMQIDADGRVQKDGAGITLTEETCDDLLDVENGEYVRVSFVKSAKELVVGVRIHQIAGDRASVSILQSEIAGLLAGAPLAQPVRHKDVVEKLAACRFDPEDPVAQRDRAFWRYAIKASRATHVPFPMRSRAMLPSSSGRNHGLARSITGRLPKLTTSELICAYVGAIRKVTNSNGSILIGHKKSLRGGWSTAAAVGPFEIEHPILVPDDPIDKTAMAQFERTLAAADHHCKFDSHAAAVELSGELAENQISPFQISFEMVPTLSHPAPKAMLHDLWLQVAQTEGQTAFRLSFDQDVVEEQMAQAIVDVMNVRLPEAISVQ